MAPYDVAFGGAAPVVVSFPSVAIALRACKLVRDGPEAIRRWDAGYIRAARFLFANKVWGRDKLQATSDAVADYDSEQAETSPSSSGRQLPLFCMSSLLIEHIDDSGLRGVALQARILAQWTPFASARERDVAVAAYEAMLALEPGLAGGSLVEELCCEHLYKVTMVPSRSPPVGYDQVASPSSAFARNLGLSILVASSVSYDSEDGESAAAP